MPPYADIYVLAEVRTEATVSAFLNRFAPLRKEMADDYSIPQHAASPHTIFHTAAEAIDYCCRHPAEPQAVYWRRLGEGDPAYAMVFFTADGFLILGLSSDEGAAERLFAELRTHAGSDIGYVTVESPPPETAAEFRQFSQAPFAHLPIDRR